MLEINRRPVSDHKCSGFKNITQLQKKQVFESEDQSTLALNRQLLSVHSYINQGWTFMLQVYLAPLCNLNILIIFVVLLERSPWLMGYSKPLVSTKESLLKKRT